MAQEVALFLRHGGHVQRIATGLSGRDPGDSRPLPTQSLFIPSAATTRTPVPEVIAAIEARRKSMLIKNTPKTSRRVSKRQRKTIYDDFGEPLRRVWVEE